MKCYYEVLGVSQNAESSELKKAYYKMSLQWHPDKTAAGSEDTTGIFQQIQEAYRVLSDPQERAWYDSHRAEILRGDGRKTQVGAASNYEEERIDVFQFFTRSCFRDFDDGPKGFYTVYRKVFEDIAEEEKRAGAFDQTQSESSSSDESRTDLENSLDEPSAACSKKSRSYPTFGQEDSSYSEVVSAFYNFWENFQTKKTYTWVEKYDTRCADSRVERRAMESENRKLRNAARRKRTEEIRQLVAFVRKRDKRVAAERERINAANREAQLRSQNLAKQAREREATRLAEDWNEQLAFGGLATQWVEDFEAELSRMEAELDGQKPQQDLKNEDVSQSDDSAAGDQPDTDLYCVACDKSFASVKAKENHTASKKHKKQAELLRQILLAEEAAAKEASEQNGEDNHICPNGLDSSTDDNECASSTVEVKLTKRAKKAQRKRRREEEKQKAVSVEASVENTVSGEPSSSPDQNPSKPDEVLTETDAEPPVNAEPSKDGHTTAETKAASVVCNTCQVEFSSRNQLFAHLRQTGHASLKTDTPKDYPHPNQSKRKGKQKR
ncbi:unnamed protein product [Calicophoron daubneyi]|uniref:Uncharacterized protein n=1 Tax=Calicophoron daubneyi TaxID=300641 RepID=A0AAV2TE58_CALDB